MSAPRPDNSVPSTPGAGLQSLARSLDMLDYFRAHESLGVTELARHLGVAKSTAHRMLATMCDRGFLEKDLASGRYRLGMRLYELGQAAAERSRMRQVALPLLEDLRQRTGQTVHLAIPEGGEVLYLVRLQTALGAHRLAKVGLRFPAHITGSGKAIAAFDSAVAEACRTRGFPTWTTSSIRTVGEFNRALDEVRHRGYAVNDQETINGMATVAAPVRDRTGKPRAALSLVSTSGFAQGHIDSQARLVTAAAARLARMLGC